MVWIRSDKVYNLPQLHPQNQPATTQTVCALLWYFCRIQPAAPTNRLFVKSLPYARYVYCTVVDSHEDCVDVLKIVPMCMCKLMC